MDVKIKAIERAITFLNASGARYHIVADDGTQYGEPCHKAHGKRTSRGPSNKNLISQVLADMQPGDVKTVPPQEGDTAQRLASNLSARAIYRWGKGSCVVVETPEHHVQILRIL